MAQAMSQHQAGPADVRVRRALFAILALGLLVRLAHLLEQPSFPYFHQPEVDAWLYHLAAQRLAAGDWLMGSEPLRMSPGYFYFLGLVYRLLGDGPWVPRVLQIGMGMGIVWLVWDSARRLLDRRWALVPTAAAALYGPYIYFEGHLLATTLGALLQMLLCNLVLRELARPQLVAGRWALVGLCWGAAAVVRPNALLLFGPVALAAFQHPGGAPQRLRARVVVVALAAGLLAVAPVSLRNLAATGEPVLLTSHGGLNFYLGNGPGATGTWRLPADVPGSGGPSAQFRAFHEKAEAFRGRSLSAREADAVWFARTLESVLQQPQAWLRLMLRKLHLFWNGRELHNVYDYEFMRVVGAVIGAPLVQFLWIAPLGLLGSLWMLWVGPRERFVSLFVWTVCAGVVLVFVTDRYRIPVVGPLLLAGAWVPYALASGRLARRPAVLAPLGLGLALAVAVALPVKVNKRFHEKYFLLGNSYLHVNQLDHAIWAYDRSLDADETFFPSRLKLAELYERSGAIDLAVEQLERALLAATAAGRSQAAQRIGQDLVRLRRALPQGPGGLAKDPNLVL